MQSVFALAFLALANAAIIDPIYYKPEAKIYNPYNRYAVENDYRYHFDSPEQYLGDSVISAPVADAVIASGAPGAYGKTAFPWASIISGAAPAVSSAIPLDAAYAPALKSGLAHAIPAVKSAAYHLVKADYPYFTAAPTSSYVESAAPVASAEDISARYLFSDALASAFPMTAASLAGAPALRASPAGLVHAAGPATHFLVASPSAAHAGIPMFKSAAAGSAAFPWALVSSIAGPASVAPGASAAAPVSLVRVASPMFGAESAFAPATAFAPAPTAHAIHAAPAFAAAPPAGFSLVASPAHASGIISSSGAPLHLFRMSPASHATGLLGAESALTGFAAAPASAVAPASAFSSAPFMFVKAISPASGVFGAETDSAFAPAISAGHSHAAISNALRTAFPASAASFAGAEGLNFARAVPTLAGADASALSGLTLAYGPAGLTAYATPAGYATLADSPALKTWIQ